MCKVNLFFYTETDKIAIAFMEVGKMVEHRVNCFKVNTAKGRLM